MVYPRDDAIEIWSDKKVTYYIVRNSNLGHYCGYCEFERRPVREIGYDGILTYVPVHGGITYANELDDGKMIYGFDCAHSGDDNNPNVVDIKWLRNECENMRKSISLARWFELFYLLAWSNKSKAFVIDTYHKILQRKGIDFVLQNNFGAMLNLLSGDL